MSNYNMQEAVARGAQWLDRTQPGWAKRINIQTLDLGSCSQCVLGQLFGGFFNVPEVQAEAFVTLGGIFGRLKAAQTYSPERWDAQWNVRHGFNVSAANTRRYDRRARDLRYKELADLWIMEIANRVHPVDEENETKEVVYG